MGCKITQKVVRTAKPRDARYEIRDTELTGFMLRVMPSGRKAFYVQWKRGRKVRLGDANVMTLTKARAEAMKTLSEAADDQTPSRAQKPAAKLSQLIDNHYEAWALSQKRSGAADVARLRSIFKPWLDKRIDQITPWLVEKHRQQRQKQGRAATTINREIATLRGALNRAVDWNLIPENPLAKVKLQKTDRRPRVRYLSDHEEQALMRALDERDAVRRAGRESGNQWRAERGYDLLPDTSGGYGDHLKPLVLLALQTGLRRGELFNLRWSDIRLDEGSATLTVRGDGAKSGQTRHVPLNNAAAAVLRTWKAQRPDGASLVFPGRGGGKLDNINKAWKALLESSGVKAFRFHDCRHHFASKLVMAGVDLNTVRELLGHQSIDMTLRYAHLSPDHKRAAVEAIG